ncbi:MAG: transcription antitermination factor NusB [Pedobacter sp.]|nr:MAG: transcription antitermination factor NusB [Pedobacter sp.]
MISRRNIRVKVMQMLYSIETLEEQLKPGEPVKLLQKQFDQSRELFIYLVHFLTEVARYSETHARNKASKHLPSAEDLTINTKIAGNEYLWKILELPSYQQAIKDEKPQYISNPDLLKKIYLDLAGSDLYNTYINTPGRDKKSEKEILEYIFTDLMLPNEHFTGFVEEHFNNWDDDGEMMNLLVLNFIAKPASADLQQLVSREKWQFAKELLETSLEKKELTMEYIKPKLKNWDPERIAALDMILMRMGVCEFLYFETIPPKVTINEYIDLAKDYSTPQSGHFVNGILDNIHKDLVKDEKMHKIAYK